MDVSYANPPIKEAVFDVKFVSEEEIDISLIESLYDILSVEYPKKEPINEQKIDFKIGQGDSEENNFQSTIKPTGIRLTSIDGLQVLQLRKDGVTFSRLDPYCGWDNFSKEAERLLDIYIKTVKPNYISRLALRFVNFINIPEITFDVSDYFNTEPSLSKGIKADMRQFFMRQVIESKSDSLMSIINQTTQGYYEDGIKILFDIDVFKENINIAYGSQDYKDLLKKLRDFRSEIFENSISDKTRKLFN